MLANSFNRTSNLLKLAQRGVHMIARPAQDSIGSEAPIPVFEAHMLKELQAAHAKNSGPMGFLREIGSENQNKLYGLIPFFWESLRTDKHYCLALNVYPQARQLEFTILHMVKGPQKVYLPIENCIPVTKYDYWGAHKRWSKQNTCLDLDMVYANRTTKEMFVFDKAGEWLDEGVYHECLDMEHTYNETNWYDEFSVHNFF